MDSNSSWKSKKRNLLSKLGTRAFNHVRCVKFTDSTIQLSQKEKEEKKLNIPKVLEHSNIMQRWAFTGEKFLDMVIPKDSNIQFMQLGEIYRREIHGHHGKYFKFTDTNWIREKENRLIIIDDSWHVFTLGYIYVSINNWKI